MALTPHPRVTIDGSSLGSPQSGQYEFEVNGVFNTMQLNRVGTLLTDEFTRSLRIQPYSGTGSTRHPPRQTAGRPRSPAGGPIGVITRCPARMLPEIQFWGPAGAATRSSPSLPRSG